MKAKPTPRKSPMAAICLTALIASASLNWALLTKQLVPAGASVVAVQVVSEPVAQPVDFITGMQGRR